MAYEYTRRARQKSGPIQKENALSRPDTEALRSGAMQPTREQMGHRVDLPEAMRAKMEAAFGADLSAVRLYESETVADAGAEAVTRGSDIAFAPGLLDFSSFGGQALLGHELSHVVSQARGEVTGSGFLDDRGLEARADREGAMAAAGEAVAMPAAALSPVSAASAAGPMQASKEEKKKARQAAEREDMGAQMAAMGFSPEEIEAQKMFQAINRHGERSEGNIAAADTMAAGLVEQNQQPERDLAALKRAQELERTAETDKSGGFLAGQMRIGAHHNVKAAAQAYQSSLHDAHRWGYRRQQQEDKEKGTSQGIIDESGKKEAAALAAETISVKSGNFSGTMRGGNLNQVYRFNQGSGASEMGGYFKPKTEDYSESNYLMNKLGIQHAKSGKVADADPKLTNREIAFSVLGKLLGSSVALESRNAQVEDSELTGRKYKDGKKEREYKIGKGDTGVMMEEAQGEDWDHYNWDFYTPEELVDTERYAERSDIARSFKAQEDTSGKLASMSDEERAAWRQEIAVETAINEGGTAENGANIGARLAKLAPGVGLKKKSTTQMSETSLKKAQEGDKERFTKDTIDAANPDFQRQMNELFLLDTLAGHPDRHGGNFRVNQTDDGKGGKSVSVKAIDNDMTFGENTDSFGKMLQWYGGLPEQMQIDANMAANIRGMKKETLETAMGHLLKKEEIEALWKKFGMMREYIDEMEKKKLIVDKWDDETAKREFLLGGGGDAYKQAQGGDPQKKYAGNNYYQTLMNDLNARNRRFKLNGR